MGFRSSKSIIQNIFTLPYTKKHLVDFESLYLKTTKIRDI